MVLQLPSAIFIYVSVIVFLLGACIGSFVTCASDRYVAKESVLRGRSHCPVCGKTLGFWELIPIFSFLFLGGRCRKCGSPIPVRCFFTELCTGLLYLVTFLRYGFGLTTLEYLLLFSALLAVALIDRDTMEIPDGLLLFGFVVYVAFLYPHGNTVSRAWEGLIAALIYGGGMLVLSLLMDRVLGRESLGGGDVKMFALLALFTGLAGGLLMLLISCILGLLFALSLGKGKKPFPFGPSIAIAAMFTLLVGQDLIEMYLSLFR